jgi:hypothetical protein
VLPFGVTLAIPSIFSISRFHRNACNVRKALNGFPHQYAIYRKGRKGWRYSYHRPSG